MTPRRPYDPALRDRLLSEASRILADQGPGALSVRAVAAAAETSTTAIYSFFGSKQELIRSIYMGAFERFTAELDSVQRTTDSAADLIALGRAYRHFALCAPHDYSVMFQCPAVGFEPTEEDIELSLVSLGRLIQAVERCVSDGSFRPADAEDVALQLWGLVHGMVSLELGGRFDPTETEARFDRALEVAIRGLAP